MKKKEYLKNSLLILI